MPARCRRRLVLLCIVGATIVPLGGAAVVGSRADASWQAMQRQAELLRAQLAGRDHRRPPLWGEAGTGNAFSHYDDAVEAAHAVMATQDQAHLLRRSGAELAADQPLRAGWRAALDELRAGSHAAEATPPPFRADRPTSSIVNLLHCRDLANIAMLEARALVHDGAPTTAVERSLDAAQFGADLLHRGLLINQMVGSAVTAIAIDWPDAALAALDPPALELLAAGLERLDRRLPVVLDHDTELLWLAANLQQTPTDGDFVPAVASWRHCFSARWTLAEAFTLAAALAHDLRQAQQLDWPQRQALIELECSAAAESPNPVLPMLVPNLRAAETNLREMVALVRLLRMAVDVHRGLDVPPLRDPLGSGPIVVTRDDTGVVLYSAGTTHRPQLQRTVRR